MIASASGSGSVPAGRYRLGDLIGSGGTGRGWEAQDVVLRRTVAVKERTLGAHLAEEDRALLQTRMQQEARATAPDASG